MTYFLDKPQTDDVVRLSGTITNYRCQRAYASFVFSESNQRQMGVIAVAAALADMGGQAAATAGAAGDVEESADHVEFNLRGHLIRGWMWRCPFRDGDEVDIAAGWHNDHYEAYGIARPADRMIALYPHCSRSRRRLIRNVIKWWAICNVLFFGFVTAMLLHMSGLKIFEEPAYFWMSGVTMAFFVLMTISLTRQYMPFVRVAQKVFIVLGLPGPKNIDLVKSSSQQRVDTDPPEFGTFYFRY